MKHIGYEKLETDISTLAGVITESGKTYDSLHPIPRGGAPVAMVLGGILNMNIVEKPTSKSLVIDDLIDSGRTLQDYPNHDTAVIYRKPHSPRTTYSVEEIDGWIEFPYEQTEKDVEHHFTRILEYLGRTPLVQELEVELIKKRNTK